MTALRLTKRDILICAVILTLVAVGELWWHRVPLLQRVEPGSYYYLLMATADQQAKQGDVRAAENLLRSAIRKFPEAPDAYQSLGDTLLKAGDTNGALTNYELAIERLGKGFTNLLSVTQQLAERPFIENKIRSLKH